MPAGTAPVVVSPPTPLIRLRHLLGFSLLALLTWTAMPRLRAAWRLRSVATSFADYALCMVGPTGPSLLRDNPPEFERLVRRRLIAANADDRPFSKCARGAFEAAGSAEVAQVHRATAASFVEYGAVDPRAADGIRLQHLRVTTDHLAALSDEGWPFARGGYTSLVLPSAYAAEAAHPMEMPRPVVARGTAPPRSVSRCDTPEGTFALGLSADKRSTIVRSLATSGITSDATLGAGNARVFALSCDAQAAVIAIGQAGTQNVLLVTCAFLGGCAATPLPHFGAEGAVPQYPLDVVRAGGVTVLAVPMHGIVRVASSRDDGATWTPFTVAFDPEAHPELRYDARVPDRLLVRGRQVVLYAATKPGGTFPMLVSDDFGAAWHG